MPVAHIVTPSRRGTWGGNRVTAVRWAAVLRRLGFHVIVSQTYGGERVDLLVALHAIKSHTAIERYRGAWPDGPLVVGLAGTDLYGSSAAQGPGRAEQSLAWADRLIVLQEASLADLSPTIRPKARVIVQSSSAPIAPARAPGFEVCVVGHLREIKDPLLCARAVRRLPERSQISVVHLGTASEAAWTAAAQRESEVNPRYRWIGGAKRRATLQTIARARLMVLTSRAEGGANVVSEALVCRTPVLSTHITGSIGILGPEYPGFFPVGDEAALAELLLRAETDPAFYSSLVQACAVQRPRFAPARETAAWADLLGELGLGRGGG